MANFDDILEQGNQPEQEEYNEAEWVAAKKQERDEVYELSDNTALEVTSDGNKFKDFLDVQSRFVRYSSVNALLIYAQHPTATHLADYDSWESQNNNVKAGQTSMKILKQGKEYLRDDGKVGKNYIVEKRFDVSQTQKGTPSEKPVELDERKVLSALIKSTFAKITGVDELPDNLRATVNPQTDEISVLKGMEFDKTFGSIAQSIAIVELKTNSDSQISPAFSSSCVAYVLCKKYGVDTKSFRFDDVSDVFEGMDARAIKEEFSKVHNVTKNLSYKMDKSLEQKPKSQER